jgi:hypothetical protein
MFLFGWFLSRLQQLQLFDLARLPDFFVFIFKSTFYLLGRFLKGRRLCLHRGELWRNMLRPDKGKSCCVWKL